MPALITIVDYGTCNVQTVYKRLQRTGATVVIGNDANDILRADKIILPGIGHFSHAMNMLHKLNLLEPLHEAVLEKKKPVLGICLGMQLMADSSEEGGNVPGLGWISGKVKLLQVPDTQRYKVPHIGWNSIATAQECPLSKGVERGASFYFTHSYYFEAAEESHILQYTDYGRRFTSAVMKDHIFGVQYHPEKSHDAGLEVLKNFVQL